MNVLVSGGGRPKTRHRDCPVNPARDEMLGFNKSWESPEAGGLRVMQGDIRGEYSAIIPLPVRTVMVRRKFRVHVLLQGSQALSHLSPHWTWRVS